MNLFTVMPLFLFLFAICHQLGAVRSKVGDTSPTEEILKPFIWKSFQTDKKVASNE
jgi:hypothetical protein